MVKGGKVSKVNIKKIVTDQVEQAVRNVALTLAETNYRDPLKKIAEMEKSLTQNPDAVNPEVANLLDFHSQLADYINGKDREEPYPANVVKIGKALLGQATNIVIKGLYIAGMNTKTRILLVEYEKWYLGGVLDYLKVNGYKCSVIQEVTGENILRAVSESEFPFDILLMCIMMPAGPGLKKEVKKKEYLTGLIVIRKIREKKPDLPIVVITVVDDPEILKEIRDMGCQVVQKVESGLQEILQAVQEAEKKIPAKTGVRAA